MMTNLLFDHVLMSSPNFSSSIHPSKIYLYSAMAVLVRNLETILQSQNSNTLIRWMMKVPNLNLLNLSRWTSYKRCRALSWATLPATCISTNMNQKRLKKLACFQMEYWQGLGHRIKSILPSLVRVVNSFFSHQNLTHSMKLRLMTMI